METFPSYQSLSHLKQSIEIIREQKEEERRNAKNVPEAQNAIQNISQNLKKQ